MWTWIVDKFAVIAGALAALGGLIFYASRQGRKAERAEQTERALEQSKESHEIDKANRGLSDAAARDKLRGDQRD